MREIACARARNPEYLRLQREAGEVSPRTDEEAMANLLAVFPDATVIEEEPSTIRLSVVGRACQSLGPKKVGPDLCQRLVTGPPGPAHALPGFPNYAHAPSLEGSANL
jgi:hypothetical protein